MQQERIAVCERMHIQSLIFIYNVDLLIVKLPFLFIRKPILTDFNENKIKTKSMANRPVTIKDIAEKLSISVSTVSRALKNNPEISLQTREAVQKLAK